MTIRQAADKKLNATAQRKLLICADWFAPGVRAGGPIRSVVNLVRLLGRTVEIEVLTSCCDLSQSQPYPGICINSWQPWEDIAQVCYATSAGRMRGFAASLSRHAPDAIYLNSMFSFQGTLWPLVRTRLMGCQARIVLAPRGMLKPSALQQKSLKKRLALGLFKRLRLFRNVVFHATSEAEIDEIRVHFPEAIVHVAPNVPAMPAPAVNRRADDRAPLKLCFVGRLHPIKNLHLVLEWLNSVKSACQLRIAGPAEDSVYAERCAALAAVLPEHIQVTFEGPLSEDRIQKLLMESDAMILPTQGENFGHAIFEAFCTGTPVIISTATMWRDLCSRNAGWDLDLDHPAEFISAIDTLAGMSSEARQVLRDGALRIAQQFIEQCDFRNEYLQLFFGDPGRMPLSSRSVEARD